MLVVGRKKNESIVILAGKEKVEIKVICSERGKVKLGVNAGDKVRIIRKELIDSMEVGHGMVEV